MGNHTPEPPITKEEIRADFYQYLAENFTGKPGVTDQHKRIKKFFIDHDGAEGRGAILAGKFRSELLNKIHNALAKATKTASSPGIDGQVLALKAILKFAQDWRDEAHD